MTRPADESDRYEPLAHGLYIVATPIGNLGDITHRAVDVLRRCDVVACEDTRVAGRLLGHLGISKPLVRYDDHASPARCAALVERARSEAVALVSDAGTPLISDPGYRLVRAAREAGIAVTSLPGPCAAIAALTMSGLPSDRFLFVGFLPSKAKARKDALDSLAQVEATLVFYESGPRLVKTLETMAELWPGREASVARELTKLHEECRSGSAQELAQHYREHPPRGEIVLLAGPPAKDEEYADPDPLLRAALVNHKPSQAAAQVAKATGLDRKQLYARAMEIKGE